jgi:hypothetical protein
MQGQDFLLGCLTMREACAEVQRAVKPSHREDLPPFAPNCKLSHKDKVVFRQIAAALLTNIKMTNKFMGFLPIFNTIPTH